MSSGARTAPALRAALGVGTALAVAAIAACGNSSDDSEAESASQGEATYSLEGATCPPGFSQTAEGTTSDLIEFTVSGTEGDASALAGVDTVDVGCAADADGDPFPFNASEIELEVAADGTLTGTATWSDSVGLSMNALVTGSTSDSLDEVSLILTAPNGDTLSEINLAASS